MIRTPQSICVPLLHHRLMTAVAMIVMQVAVFGIFGHGAQGFYKGERHNFVAVRLCLVCVVHNLMHISHTVWHCLCSHKIFSATCWQPSAAAT